MSHEIIKLKAIKSSAYSWIDVGMTKDFMCHILCVIALDRHKTPHKLRWEIPVGHSYAMEDIFLRSDFIVFKNQEVCNGEYVLIL